MASPVVAGVAAMLLSYYPHLSADDVKEIIMTSSRKFDGLQVIKPGTKDELINFADLSVSGGVINAYEAVRLAESRTISSSNPIIPHTNFDQLVLKTGQSLDIDFVGTNQNGIQFRLNDNDGLLTVPFSNVRSLTSRMGDVIYPEAIEFRKSY